MSDFVLVIFGSYATIIYGANGTPSGFWVLADTNKAEILVKEVVKDGDPLLRFGHSSYSLGYRLKNKERLLQ
jgi:hypothetical protein